MSRKKDVKDKKDAKPTPADLAAAARLKAIWDERRKALKLTQQRMGERMGITQGGVGHYLHGRSPLNFHAVMAFAEALQVDPRAIRDDLKEMKLVDALAPARNETGVREPAEAPSQIPIFGARAAAGGGAMNEAATEIGSIFFRPSSLRRAGIAPGAAAALYVHGDSMLPRLRHGDTIVYDRTDTKLRDGRLYVLSVDSHEFVKRLRFYDGRWWMSSDNKADPSWAQDVPVRPDSQDFRVLGRVRWIGSWEP